MMFSDFCDITIGGRYDEYDEYGSSFVPRLGVTKIWDKIHIKAMASQSFRTPGGIVPNRIPTNYGNIKPEKATNYEIEWGCQFTDNMFIVLNFYDIIFKRVIIYQSDPVTGVGSYFNSGKTGTRGIETEYRYMGKKLNEVFR